MVVLALADAVVELAVAALGSEAGGLGAEVRRFGRLHRVKVACLTLTAHTRLVGKGMERGQRK